VSKLITLTTDGLKKEIDPIDNKLNYLTTDKGLPIVLNNQGNFVVLNDYDIIDNKLKIYSYGGNDFEYMQVSHFTDIYEKSRGCNSLKFILED
jgi:hypothetical protein